MAGFLLRHFLCGDLDARGAQKHPNTGNFAFLQVWILAALGSDIGMASAIRRLGFLLATLANFHHGGGG